MLIRNQMILIQKNKPYFSVYSIGILALVVLIGLCSHLAAEDASQTGTNVSPVQIGVKYQAIKAIYKKLTNQDKPEELEKLVEKSSEFVASFPEYKRVDEVYYYLGNALVRLERVEEGTKVFEKLVKEHPKARYVQPGMLELGMAYDKLGKHDKADEVYKKLIDHPEFGSRSYAKLAKKIFEQDKSSRKGELPNRAATSATRPNELIGKPAPGFQVKDLKGKELSLKKYRGQVVLLDFWATWCGPCIAELPNVKKAYANYKDQKFQIIGISLDRSTATLETFIKREGLAWDHYWDGDQKVSNQYGVTGIPSTFLIDGEGVIRKTNLRGHSLEIAVAELVKENLAKPDKTPTKTPKLVSASKSVPATEIPKKDSVSASKSIPAAKILKKDDAVKPSPSIKKLADSPKTGQNEAAKVKEIVDAAVAAHGGLEKLQAVKNIVIESQSFEYFSDGTVQDEGQNKTYYYPNKFRSDWNRNGSKDSLMLDGDALFQLTNGQLNDIPPEVVKSTVSFFKDSLFREPIWLLTNLSQNEIPVKYAGTADIKEEPTSVLLITQPSGRKLKVFISEKTGYIVQYIYGYDIRKDKETVIVSFDKYRDVDGVKIAHHRTTKNGEYRQVLITDIKLNVEIDEALFSPNESDE